MILITNISQSLRGCQNLTSDDGVVEDLLWNSLDGTVLKQRGKDRSLEDLLPQKGQIGGMRVRLSPSTQPPF